jgi:prevent-host-death family protein
MSSTPTLTVSVARAQLASIIDRVRVEHTPIYLARRGRRVAAVIDAGDLDRILELAEDMADIRAAAAARAEMQATGEAPIPWEQVKVDLGLTLTYRIALAPRRAPALHVRTAGAPTHPSSTRASCCRTPTTSRNPARWRFWRVESPHRRLPHRLRDRRRSAPHPGPPRRPPPRDLPGAITARSVPHATGG